MAISALRYLFRIFFLSSHRSPILAGKNRNLYLCFWSAINEDLKALLRGTPVTSSPRGQKHRKRCDQISHTTSPSHASCLYLLSRLVFCRELYGCACCAGCHIKVTSLAKCTLFYWVCVFRLRILYQPERVNRFCSLTHSYKYILPHSTLISISTSTYQWQVAQIRVLEHQKPWPHSMKQEEPEEKRKEMQNHRVEREGWFAYLQVGYYQHLVCLIAEGIFEMNFS